MCRALHRNINGSPGGADVHYTVDTLRNALYPDLASCLIVLKTNAVQSALHAPCGEFTNERSTDFPSEVSLQEETLGL